VRRRRLTLFVLLMLFVVFAFSQVAAQTPFCVLSRT
jgi:hypothetical protein